MDVQMWWITVACIALCAISCAWFLARGVEAIHDRVQVPDEVAPIPTFAPPALTNTSFLIQEPTVVPYYLLTNAQATRT